MGVTAEDEAAATASMADRPTTDQSYFSRASVRALTARTRALCGCSSSFATAAEKSCDLGDGEMTSGNRLDAFAADGSADHRHAGGKGLEDLQPRATAGLQRHGQARAPRDSTAPHPRRCLPLRRSNPGAPATSPRARDRGRPPRGARLACSSSRSVRPRWRESGPRARSTATTASRRRAPSARPRGFQSEDAPGGHSPRRWARRRRVARRADESTGLPLSTRPARCEPRPPRGAPSARAEPIRARDSGGVSRPTPLPLVPRVVNTRCACR